MAIQFVVPRGLMAGTFACRLHARSFYRIESRGPHRQQFQSWAGTYSITTPVVSAYPHR